MGNIADLIEEYILRRLAAEQKSEVELRRNDIAEEISCAPSQISYVLNTRFTLDRGFTVESRRGLGGFIRIVKMPLENKVYGEMLDAINVFTTFGEVQEMVRYLLRNQLISRRESALAMQSIAFAYENLLPEVRCEMVRSVFLTLADFS